MKMGAEKSERLYEEISDYEKLKSIFGDVIYIFISRGLNYKKNKRLYIYFKVSRRLQSSV